jgi:hypothetical protein
MAGRIAYLGNITTQGLVLDLDAGIKGSYPGSGTTWTDISNNGNNGTLTNGPTFTGSDYGAIRFDGTDDYVDCGTANPIPNSWTLTSWVQNSVKVGYGNIIGRSAGIPLYEQNATLGWSSVRSSSFSVGGKLTNGTFYYECTSSAFLNTGSILNVVGSFNEPTTTLTLYINGAPVNTKNTGFSMTLTGSQKIQVGCSDGNSLGNFFSGSIYQAQIYNQALTQFQVWQNFNSYKSRYGIPDIVTDGLVLNLDAGNPYSYLSGSSGTTWTNTAAVSSSISGTLTNGPVYSNGAITFDGTNDYVSIPYSKINPVLSGSTSLTVSCWVYNNIFHPTDGTTFISWPISNNSAVSPFTIFALGADKTGSLNSSIGNGTTRTILFSGLTINTGSWYNIGFVWDGTTQQCFVNGVIQGASIGSSYTLGTPSGNADVFIGTYNTNNVYWLNGRMSNVQIYNRALSATEVQQNFNALRGRYGI